MIARVSQFCRKVEREPNILLKLIEPHACAIKIKNQFFGTWLTLYNTIAIIFWKKVVILLEM